MLPTLAPSSSVGNDQSSSDLDSSKPAALSFKILEAGQQEIRPPLTPATEVDLQKSCAKLVQSTGYSKSFKDAVNSKTTTTTQRRGNGAIPVIRGHGRTPSKGGSRTPVGRVVKQGAGHRRTGSTARYEKTSTSKYVPPRRPAPEKALPVARRVMAKEHEAQEEKDVKVVQEKPEPENRPVKKKSTTEKERGSSDGSSGEEAHLGKNKKGVKKLVNVVTGYIRPHDQAGSSPQLIADSRPSPTRNEANSSEVSPSKDKTNPAEALKIRSSKRKDGTTYLEALPDHLHTKTSSDEERKPGEPKRSVSKRLGHAMKEYVKPPHIDRFTPEPLPNAPVVAKEDSKNTDQKKRRVTKTMREYVRPSPIDISHVTIEEEDTQASKPEKTPKSAKSLPAAEKPSSPAAKELQKTPTETAPSKPVAANGHSHHNPFRLLHDYVKPSMTDPPPLQTNISPASTHLSPVLPSERRPLTPQNSQPSISYIPPKIRPRGKTLPSNDNPLSLDSAVPSVPSKTRQGPIFGGGYPVKQDHLVVTASASKDKENRGPTSPGFFGRNPGGSGFRIHFSHFLNKQRTDGYDQLE